MRIEFDEVQRPKVGEPTRRYTTTSAIRSCAHVTYLVWTGATLRGLDPAKGRTCRHCDRLAFWTHRLAPVASASKSGRYHS